MKSLLPCVYYIMPSEQSPEMVVVGGRLLYLPYTSLKDNNCSFLADWQNDPSLIDDFKKRQNRRKVKLPTTLLPGKENDGLLFSLNISPGFLKFRSLPLRLLIS